MNYRKDKYGNKLSILGFGCMRFPSKYGKIDFEETEREILHAFENGVNYYDTAYIYPGSEATLGRILEKNSIRNKVNIATKLPHYLIKSKSDFDRFFSEELERLRTDYIDYYLIHMLTDTSAWDRLKELGIEEWIDEKKRKYHIKNIGFSYHGNSNMFCELIDAYSWDFCMIQYNYMDKNTQAGVAGLQYAHSKNIPVIIMEPLRGGRLVTKLPEKAKKIFNEYPVTHSPASWALRWLWNQPEVTVVLSGMNSMEMISENICTASECKIGDIGSDEEEMLCRVADAINEKLKVGCTGCGYCMPCPKNVDIPGTFAAYNRKYSEGSFAALKDYVMCTVMRKKITSASNCVLCGKCESHCPQNIEIRNELKNASKNLEGIIYKIFRFIVSKAGRF